MIIFGPRTQKFGILVTNYSTKHMFFEFLKNDCFWILGPFWSDCYLILLRPTPKSFFFHVVSRMTNSKIRPQKIWGIPADFAYIATSDFENWPKLYFTAKLAQFGLEMIIRPFSSKFWKKINPHSAFQGIPELHCFIFLGEFLLGFLMLTPNFFSKRFNV